MIGISDLGVVEHVLYHRVDQRWRRRYDLKIFYGEIVRWLKPVSEYLVGDTEEISVRVKEEGL